MVDLYTLGIFSDFFNWLRDYVDGLVASFVNTYRGLLSLVSFLFAGLGWFSQITVYLPAIFTAIITLSLGALVIKFVLGR